jgi:predicted anti-sigma-YlaC factor YlaD
MKDLTCEKVLMAMMAAADGETAQFSPQEIKIHLSGCENCRDEAVRMQQVSNLFREVTRRERPIDLWPAIDSRLDQLPPRIGWQLYAIVVVLLLAYKLVELLPKADPGWIINLVPLIIFGALLVFVRENPFRINTELLLEK